MGLSEEHTAWRAPPAAGRMACKRPLRLGRETHDSGMTDKPSLATLQALAILVACLLRPTQADACSESPTARILHDTGAYAQKARIVARAHVVALRSEQPSELETAEFAVLRAYKGAPNRDLLVRYRFDWCVGRPPLGQEVYLFVFNASDGLAASLNFIPADRVPKDFDARLGSAQAPQRGRSNLPSMRRRLAPVSVPDENITRIEGGIVEERWSVRLKPVRNWAIPRFYVRLPEAFVFFEPDHVRAVAERWGDADLQRGVLGALPLKVPTDLYQFALMGRVPRPADGTLQRFTLDALLSGNAIVLANSGGYLDEIRITRTSRREQIFETPAGLEILRTRW